MPLREFIDRLRGEFRVPYRLAGRRPYVGSGRRLLVDLQDRSHLDPEFCLVAAANGQVVLTAPGEEFYERVDWSGDEPAGWRPHEDPDSPVRINPWCVSGCPRSAASPLRPSRASLMAEHPPDHRLAGGARMPPWLPGARRRLLTGLTWAERALPPIRVPRIGVTEHLRRYGIGRAAEPSGALTGWQSLFMTVMCSE